MIFAILPRESRDQLTPLRFYAILNRRDASRHPVVSSGASHCFPREFVARVIGSRRRYASRWEIAVWSIYIRDPRTSLTEAS